MTKTQKGGSCASSYVTKAANIGSATTTFMSDIFNMTDSIGKSMKLVGGAKRKTLKRSVRKSTKSKKNTKKRISLKSKSKHSKKRSYKHKNTKTKRRTNK